MRRINWLTVIWLAVLAAGLVVVAQPTTAPTTYPATAPTPSFPATHSATAPANGASSRPANPVTSKPASRPSTGPTSHPTVAVTRPVEIELVATLGDAAFRHGDDITKVLILDAQRVLTAGGDGTARIWDRKTGKQLLRIDAEACIWDAVVAGKLLYTCGDDGDVVVWELESGKRTGGLGLKGRFSRMAMDPSGKLLALCGSNEFIQTECVVWDLAAGRAKAAFTIVGGPETIAFDAKGERLIVGLDEGVIREWRIPGLQERTLRARDVTDEEIGDQFDVDDIRRPRDNAVSRVPRPARTGWPCCARLTAARPAAIPVPMYIGTGIAPGRGTQRRWTGRSGI